MSWVSWGILRSLLLAGAASPIIEPIELHLDKEKVKDFSFQTTEFKQLWYELMQVGTSLIKKLLGFLKDQKLFLELQLLYPVKHTS